MPKLGFLVNAFFLLASLFLVYFWTENPATSLYTLQLIALFVLLYFLNQLLSRGQPNLFLNTLIFTIVILLLVSTTGGLGSPLFFLVYFLLFGTALLMETELTIFFTLALVVFFLFLNPLDNLNNLIALASLLFISPLAFFFGKQYLQVLKDKKRIEILEKTDREMKKALKREETDSLLWLSLELKKGLLRIIEKTSQLLSRPASFKWREKEVLEEILASSQRLLRTGEKLKKEIDEATD